jgi:hypothetical protein
VTSAVRATVAGGCQMFGMSLTPASRRSWSTLVLAAALLIRDVRRAVPELVATLVTPPVSPLLLGAVLYVSALVAIAAALGLWTVSLLGVTILWFLGPGIVMFVNSNDAVTDPHYLRKALRGSVFLTAIVEAVATLVVFPLAVEMIVLPVLLCVVLLGAAGATRPELAPVKTIMDVLLGIFGVVFVARTVYAVVADFESYATHETLMRLLLPPALTVAFLGYIYFLRFYILWEHRRLHPT